MAAPGTLLWVACNVDGSSAIPAARTYATLVSSQQHQRDEARIPRERELRMRRRGTHRRSYLWCVRLQISYGSSLYLFGGYGEEKGRYSDVYEYSLPSHHWRLIPPQGDIPRPVYLHSAVQHGHDMIVFGGNSGRESNDLYTYNLDTFTWKREGAAGGFLSMGAAMPAARYGHASCVYGVNQHAGGSLLIVGGCKSNNTYFKDAWSMDLTSKRWKKLDDLPLDLAYHSLITWQERAYLFGGYNGKSFVQHMYVLDSVTGKWNILQVSGQSPPPMCGAATVLKGNDLYVFAGYTERGHTNELYRLNMATRVWSLLPTSNKPQARAYLQAAVIGDRCSVFGGYDGAHCISDFRCVTLPSPNGQSASSYPAHSLAQQQQAHPPVNIFTDAFFGQSTAVAADAVLQNFGGGYGEQLSKAQVLNMVAALQISWRQKASQMAQLQIAAAQSLAAQASVGGGQNYPFDTSKLGAIEALGFSKEHVLRAMAKMHAAGQNTKNIDLVADMCLREPESGSSGSDDVPNQATLDRREAERVAMKQKIESLMENAEEARTCKICFDASINCALQDCGHLCVCTSCADSLKGRPCPICQRPIKSYLKIYWS